MTVFAVARRAGRSGRRASSASPGAATRSRASGTRSGRRPSRTRARPRCARATSDRGRSGEGRVSASSVTTHVAGRRFADPAAAPTPCRPAGGQWASRRRPVRLRLGRAMRWRRCSGRRRRSPRARRAPPLSASSSGPIRSASSRAGITTLIVEPLPWRLGRRPSGGRRRACPCERVPPSPRSHRGGRSSSEPRRQSSHDIIADHVRRDRRRSARPSSRAAVRRQDGSIRRRGTARAAACGCAAGRTPRAARSTTCRRSRHPTTGHAVRSRPASSSR